jgi:hypothetical protein
MRKIVVISVLFGIAVSFVAGAAFGGDETVLPDPAALEARLAESPKDLTLLVEAGSAWLARAMREEKHATERAADLLGRAVELAPDSAQILVLYGTALTLKGRDAVIPLLKMSHVQKGLAEMDRAVVLAPMDISIRMQRGMTCAKLPAVFARADTALVDFRHLQAMAARVPGTVPEGLVAEAKRQIARILAERGTGK